ncbi:MAG: ABC transporter substrate-binding protein [Phycisphaerae bacterium]
MKPCISLSVLAIAAMALPGCRDERPLPEATEPRVVTYSPALTRMVFDLGLGDHIVGVTDYCDLPDGSEIPRVGDINVVAEKILAVEPEIVLTQQAGAFEAFADQHKDLRVIHVEIDRLADIPEAAIAVSAAMGDAATGQTRADLFNRALQETRQAVAELPRPRTLFLEGTDRPGVHSEGSFIDDMIQAAGGAPAAREIPGNQSWRKTRLERIVAAGPEVLVVKTTAADEAADRDYWMQWKDIPAVKAGRVHMVTDDAWMRPGLHMAELTAQMAAMIHPELAP